MSKWYSLPPLLLYRWRGDPGDVESGYDPKPVYVSLGASAYDCREVYAPYYVADLIRAWRSLHEKTVLTLYWWGFLDVEEGRSYSWRNLTLRAGRTHKKRLAAQIEREQRDFARQLAITRDLATAIDRYLSASATAPTPETAAYSANWLRSELEPYRAFIRREPWPLA